MSGTCTHRCPACGSTTAPALEALVTGLAALQQQALAIGAATQLSSQAVVAALQPVAAPAAAGLTVWLVTTHDEAQPTALVVAADAAEAAALCNEAYGQGTTTPGDVRALSLRAPRLLPDAWQGDAL